MDGRTSTSPTFTLAVFIRTTLAAWDTCSSESGGKGPRRVSKNACASAPRGALRDVYLACARTAVLRRARMGFGGAAVDDGARRTSGVENMREPCSSNSMTVCRSLAIMMVPFPNCDWVTRSPMEICGHVRLLERDRVSQDVVEITRLRVHSPTFDEGSPPATMGWLRKVCDQLYAAAHPVAILIDQFFGRGSGVPARAHGHISPANRR